MTNAGPDEAAIDVLPTIWFRNTGVGPRTPSAGNARRRRHDDGHPLAVGTYHLDPGPLPDGSMLKPTMCSNETNDEALFGTPSITDYPKDGSTGTCA